MEIEKIARMLLVFGGILLIAGGLFWVASKFTDTWKMPGDIVIRRENFTFYFPIVTCIVISVVISLVLYLVRKLGS
jgi:uncharacterized membrane protein YidH (DUF202 family)